MPNLPPFSKLQPPWPFPSRSPSPPHWDTKPSCCPGAPPLTCRASSFRMVACPHELAIPFGQCFGQQDALTGCLSPCQCPQSSSCLTPPLATTWLRSQHAQQWASPIQTQDTSEAASIVAEVRERVCELRKGQQEQKRPEGSPVTCDFRWPKWSVNPKPHSHIVEPRLKYAGRQMKVWTLIINAGTSTMKTIWKKMEIIITCASWDCCDN